MIRRALMRASFLGAIIAAAACACVPSASDIDPRGALNLRLNPSPGSRGEAFTTSDGWTIHVDAFVLQTYANASGETPDGSGSFGKPAQTDVLFLASKQTQLLTYAIPAGRALVQVGFSIHALRPPSRVEELELNNQGVPPELAARFNQRPDLTFIFLNDDDFTVPDEEIGGPSFLLILHAEKEGRVVRLDVSMQDAFPSDPIPGFVAANTVTDLDAIVAVENIFRDDTTNDDDDAVVAVGGALSFGVFADADKDADGIISAKELRMAHEPCTSIAGGCSEEQKKRMTLAQAISRRIGRIFVPGNP